MTLFNLADNPIIRWARLSLAQSVSNPYELTPAQLYAALEMYYLSNGLYENAALAAYDAGFWMEGLKPIRNPAHRVVEFYVAKLWPGALPAALPIVTDNEKITPAVEKLWEWSAWGVKKQLAARWFALFGDWFCKVATKNDPAGNAERVYLQTLKPNLVTEFDEDERGFLTFIRLDIPRTRRTPNGQTAGYTHTEVWDKESQTLRIWHHTKPDGEDLDRLGPPVEVTPFASFGIDFVPFTHARFQDIGEPRGMGAFTHALDKIDEASRQATRISQMMFRYNRPTWAILANGLDPTGRPLPAPRISTDPDSGGPRDGTISLGDDKFLYLPGNSTIQALVPSINYADALAVLQAHMSELERDLPELAYYRIQEMGGDLSGKAVRYLLSDAVDKVKEARGNIESALAQAHMMALTIGAAAGLEGFTDLGGTFEEGAFNHKFADREIIPLSEFENAEIIAKETAAGIPLKTSLRRKGWSEEELEQLQEDKDEETEAAAESFGQAVLTQGRAFDRGQTPGAQGTRPPAGPNPASQNPPPAAKK